MTMSRWDSLYFLILNLFINQLYQDDMQRKYQQQLASTALKRGNSSASIVVKRDTSVRKEALLKVEPVAKRAPVEDEMTVGEMLRAPPRVEAGKMQEARSSFFSSMIAASNSSSSAPASVHKLGTSIVPAGLWRD